MLIQPILIAIKESGLRWQYRGTEDALDKPYIYYHSGLRTKVMPGFTLDGASSPRLLWSLTGFLPRGIHDPAALVHDQLYEDKGFHNGQHYTRKQADQIFYEMLKQSGVKSWHAWGAYLAVRAGGWLYWNKTA